MFLRLFPAPLLALLALLFSPLILAADATTEGVTGGKSVSMQRQSSEPEIDGLLDDAEWAQAEVVEDFHQMKGVTHHNHLHLLRYYQLHHYRVVRLHF